MYELAELPDIVGRNARAYRERQAGATLEEVAVKARENGLTTWVGSTVSSLERGRVSPTVPTLYMLARTYTDLVGKPITIADLCAYAGPIRLSEHLTIHGESLAAALRGRPADGDIGDAGTEAWRRAQAQHVIAEHGSRAGVSITELSRAIASAGLAEQRAAKDLGVDVERLALLALSRWGRTWSAERDDRAGEGANAQRRGQVARSMKDELREELSCGDR